MQIKQPDDSKLVEFIINKFNIFFDKLNMNEYKRGLLYSYFYQGYLNTRKCVGTDNILFIEQTFDDYFQSQNEDEYKYNLCYLAYSAGCYEIFDFIENKANMYKLK